MKFILLLLISLMPVTGLTESGEIITVHIGSKVQYQRIDGFGVSDAWRCRFAGRHWPQEKRETASR